MSLGMTMKARLSSLQRLKIPLRITGKSPTLTVSARNASSITPSVAFGKTLQFITNIKLDELQKQREAYSKHAQVLEQARAVTGESEADLVKKVEILLAAARAWSGSGAFGDTKNGDVSGRLNLKSLDLWLAQAKADPSFSKDVLRGWADVLEAHIKHNGTRFEYASLFGNLFNEWVENEGVSSTAVGEAGAQAGDDATAGSEEIGLVGRKELHEQKDQLISLIFKEKTTDLPALQKYLDGLFAGKDATAGLKRIRESNKDFCQNLARTTITVHDVRWIIHSLLSADLLDNEKRSTLREFLGSPVVLNEVASVLNMRLAAFTTWAWPKEGVGIEMRRHLNGKYRAFMESEIVDALFLEYVGKKFQVQFKSILQSFTVDKPWNPSIPPLEKVALQRRMAQLLESSTGTGVEEFRHDERRKKYFLNQLPNSEHTSPVYDSSGSGDYGTSSDRTSSSSGTSVNPVEIKQSLLHLMATEGLLNRTLHGSHTVVRTDFEWFGPSLPHDAILAVLEYFGIHQDWLGFIRSFLSTPLRFKDDPSSEVRIRKCGTPISHALSSMCGEVVMFVMDFAVNQRANGLFLYRIHDDLWLWDAKSTRCVAAWKEMQVFASLVGLNFNLSKTGSACVGGVVDPGLPAGDIRWGFLQFDVKLGRFVIDQAQVDEHVVELQRQLAATKSVFGWINAYNKYVAFFVRNFGGRPAFCFGPAHADDMIATLARIQNALFPDEGGVIGHLSRMIETRFGIKNIPQGYFLFPVGSGGLEVRNPLVELFAIRTLLKDAPEKFFQDQIEQDAKTYLNLKENWDTRPPSSLNLDPAIADIPFMPFNEYIAHRETRLSSWRSAFVSLLDSPEPQHVSDPPTLAAILKSAECDDGFGLGGDQRWLSLKWCEMSFYQKWVIAMYADEMVKKFGSLAIVDPTLIPVGMVQLFKSLRMRWEQ